MGCIKMDTVIWVIIDNKEVSTENLTFEHFSLYFVVCFYYLKIKVLVKKIVEAGEMRGRIYNKKDLVCKILI